MYNSLYYVYKDYNRLCMKMHRINMHFLSGTIPDCHFRCIYDILFPREELFWSNHGQPCVITYLGHNQLNNTIGKNINAYIIDFTVDHYTSSIKFVVPYDGSTLSYFQVIPRTSYYKIIDVWFLFLVIMLVLTITFHSIIMMMLGKFLCL